MSDLLFLNLLRTSLIVGALTLILTLLSPFWDRRFSARWKKRLWYLLSLVLLAGIFFPIPGGRAPIVVALPEQTIQVVHRQSGIPRVQAATPETVAPHAPGHPGGGEAPLMDAPTSPAPAAQTSVPFSTGCAAGRSLWNVGGLRRHTVRPVGSGAVSDRPASFCMRTPGAPCWRDHSIPGCSFRMLI